MEMFILIGSDILILLLFYLYAIHFKLRSACKKMNKKSKLWQAAIILYVVLSSPFTIIFKMYRSGELRKIAQKKHITKKRLILYIFKVTYVDMDNFFDYIIKRMVQEYYCHDKCKKSIKKQSNLYTDYFKLLQFA